MFGIHRTTAALFGRRAARAPANSRPAHHRRRRAWRVEYLEGRTLLSQFDVINLNDSGAGSLRQAIELSNNTPGPNEIDFSAGLSGTITLTSGELRIANHDLTIVGPGQNSLTVSGNGSSRVFDIASGVTALLAGMTITGGRADNGGGMYNTGTVTINACTITGNYVGDGSGGAGVGGGIVNSGTMTLTNSSVASNSTGDGDGGGIANSGTMTLINSSVTGNVTGTDSWSDPWVYPWFWGHGGGNGGGMYNSGTMILTNSTVSDNTSNLGQAFEFHGYFWAGDGGGIYNGSGTVTLTNSTVAGNQSSWLGGGICDGGGIYNGSGTVTLTNSTVAGNQSSWLGGGIYDGSGTVTLTNSTVAGNQSSGWPGWRGGGGIFSSGSATLTNTIVANNPSGGDLSGFGTVAGRSNLIGDGSGGLDPATNLLNVDPKLGPLQDNGGPTMTMALLPGSPAIDAGSNDLILAGVQYDQRGPGFQRIVNGTVDIGAFEWQPYVSSSVASWGNQNAPLQLAADGLRLLPAGRKMDLPWQDIKQLTITLSTAETLTSDDLTVSSARGTDYGATLSGSGTDYTITLAAPITQADRVTIRLNLAGMVTSTHELDVLPGDVNDDGIVNAQDMVLIRNEILKTGDPLMIGWADIDGLGGVNLTDYIVARKKLGSRLI
jgi:hypothetical protein